MAKKRKKETVRRKVYCWPSYCEVCGGEFRPSRRHAFLCSPACRKRFSRLGPAMQDAIRRVVECRMVARPITEKRGLRRK